MTATVWPWAALLLLGAVHGLNPGMGWLFAVALGLQERDRGAVWGALLPMAAGHAAAIGVALAAAAAIGLALPLPTVRLVVAAGLLLFGAIRLVRHCHPRWAAMRVSPHDLVLWSFLMASAHGAGLMALPFAMRAASSPYGTMRHASAATHHAMQHSPVLAGLLPDSMNFGLAATLVHTAGYLLVTLLVAIIVYERLGLRILRSAWVNLDLIWALALIGTAVVTATS